MRSGETLIDMFTQLLSELFVGVDEYRQAVSTDEDDIDLITLQLMSLHGRIVQTANRALEVATCSEQKEACYAFVSFCDDFFIYRTDWGARSAAAKQAIRDYWLSHLCEWECFGTRVAGWKLPHTARELSLKANHTDESRALAFIYAQIFWLGFGPSTREVLLKNAKLRSELLFIAGDFNSGSRGEVDCLGYMPPSNQFPARLAPVAYWLQSIRNALSLFVGAVLVAWVTVYFWVQSTLSGMVG